MSDCITIPSKSSVDMLRFRLLYRGEPGAALEWFEKTWADVKTKFGKVDPKNPHRKTAVRYPINLRVGSYREMFLLPAGESSITLAMGRNGQGSKQEFREGFLEFNPAKTYPSKELEFLYKLLDSEPNVKLELVRWDFATDYPIERESVTLVKDGRKYSCVISESHTQYLGRRNNGGFVKVYDKQAELNKAGKICPDQLTRVEVTIEEPLEDIGKHWPRLVVLPDKVPNQSKGILGLILLAVLNGADLEEALQKVGKNQRSKYRKEVVEICGGRIEKPSEYAACRKYAQSWAKMYGGNGYALIQ